MATVYFARRVLLPDFTVIDNGAVAVDGAIITSVGTRGTVKRSRGDRSVNLGQMLLMPGLINMHTHLEEGVLRGGDDSGEAFSTRFARRATLMRQAATRAVSATVRLGAREMLSGGVTSVFDSSSRGISAGVLAEEPIRAWVHCEIHPEAAETEDDYLARLENRVAALPPGVRAAAGPYALFSFSPRAHRAAIAATRKLNVLWACHLAESGEEVQAFSEQTGDLHFMLTRHRPWPFGDNSAGPMYCAITNSLLPNNAICFHCTYATGNDLALLAVKQVSPVICLRYSQACRERIFPLDLALNRGMRVCAATESAADVPTLSLFDELFSFRAAFPHVPAADLLAMVTRNAAAALGMSGKLGALAPGHFADMIGVRVSHDPKEQILDELLTEEPSVAFVMVDGEEVVVEK